MNDLSENRPACKSASEPFDLAAAYVHALTGTSGAPIDVRMLHETDKGEPGHPLRGTLSDLWSAIQSGQAEGRGAFVTVNQTDGKGRKAENINAIRAVWIDLDGADAADQYAAACAFDPAPSFAVVSSPGRWHVYWVLALGCPLDLAASINRRLVSKFNGDRSASDIARVLRLPGSHHLKQPDTPHLVTCHQLSGFGHPVDCQTLDTALADQPEHGGTGKRRSLGHPDLAAPSIKWLRRALALIDPNDLDRDSWVAFSAAWKQAGWSLTDDETLFAMWSDWCADYKKNDSSENDKQWRSIKQTEVGWPAILRRIPALRAEQAFGNQPGHSTARAVQKVHSSIDLPAAGGTTGAPSLLDVVQACRDWSLPVSVDQFADRLVLTGPLPFDRTQSEYPRPLRDSDYSTVQIAFNSHGQKVTKDALRDGVDYWAMMNAINPVTDWLNSLQWDGTGRLDGWLVKYLGAEKVEWCRLIAAKFIIGMVARAMRPGCKMDNALVLEGPQGIAKSTVLRVLAGEAHFGDQLPNMRDKEALQFIAGLWLVEIGELAALNRSEVEDVKQFLTARVDRYRPSYGRLPVDRPRTTVFAATTNQTEYLKDSTGNRRWWPVRCGTIDVDGLATDREQLFAEAVSRYRAGERWWLTVEEETNATVQQEERQERDPWTDMIVAYCASISPKAIPITMDGILRRLGFPEDRQNPQITKRVRSVLQSEGYAQKRMPGSGARYYQKA